VAVDERPTLRSQVLVVGAGPVGAILALELAHHGVACTVVERSVTAARHPGLDLLSGRGMELLRRLGLADLVRRHGVPADSAADLQWRRGLDDPPVLISHSAPFLDSAPSLDDGSVPVERQQRVSGTELARQLRAVLRGHPLVDLREGWTFTGLRAEAGGAVVNVIETRTGIRHAVQAQHVAGCDGAQSTVRRCLDVPMQPLGPAGQHCSVFFRSADPCLPAGERSLSTIIVGGLTTVSRSGGDTWVGHLPVPSDEPVTTDPVSMLRGRLGLGLEVPEILGVTQWDDSLAVATAYRSGPVYLVGEAAHRFHPVSDLADTSIGDAVDLGWKLAAVISGWGGPELLASYECERRPCALIDRELLTRELETRRRFNRLVTAGAGREFLAGVLRQETHFGSRLAGRYDTSPIIWYDDEAADPLRPTTTRPGGRAPAVRLRDGTHLFDRLGPALTLVDLTPGGAGRPLVDAANERGIPVTHLHLTDPAARAVWDRPLVLVRPDQHIAWRAGAPTGPTGPDRSAGSGGTAGGVGSADSFNPAGFAAAGGWHAVLDLVLGFRPAARRQDHVNA